MTLKEVINSDVNFQLQCTPYLPVKVKDFTEIKFLMFQAIYMGTERNILPKVMGALYDENYDVHVAIYKNMIFYSFDAHKLISKLYKEEKDIILPTLDILINSLIKR